MTSSPGRSYAEIGVDIFAPDPPAPPGGETWQSSTRVARAFESFARARAADLADHHGPSVAGGRALVVRPEGDPGVWANTSLTVIAAWPPHEIALLNCSAHLAGLETPAGPLSAPV
jgi:hypothetical protein